MVNTKPVTRDAIIRMRVPASEKAIIVARAERLGISVTAYLLGLAEKDNALAGKLASRATDPGP